MVSVRLTMQDLRRERTRTRPAGPGRAAAWQRVHEVVGPLTGSPAPTGLYFHGGGTGAVTPTPTGPRLVPVVPPHGRIDFGAYLNVFPAALWRTAAGSRSVRLTVSVDDVAVLTVRRSDATGAAHVAEKRLLTPDRPERVEVDIDRTVAGGLVWFDLQAGSRAVTLLDAAWEVREAARPGGLVVGTPTTGRVEDIAANLATIAAAPALVAVLERVVVVDHAAEPVAAALGERDAALPRDLLRVVRQSNLGGSGGFSRAMHEALAVPGAEAVLLLDDDIRVEPAALLKAFEFGRRTAGGQIVGLQMLDLARPSVLEAGPEQIVPRSFWWTASEPTLTGTDLAARPVHEIPALHRPSHSDFAGWWGSLVPLDVIRAVGYAMPLFLKWDDAEFALRAHAAGFGTISLTGAAVWHETWRGKDDARTWPAFFHARNRVVAALLHGSAGVRTGLLLDGLLLEVKQLLALQTFAVARRQEGMRAVLAGPDAFDEPAAGGVDRLRRLADAAPDQRRIPAHEATAAAAARARVPAPRRAPVGVALGVWAALQVTRHLVAPVEGRRPPGRIEPDRGTWWVLPSYDHVLAPTADGAAFFQLRRDPRRFRALLASSVALHLRMWLAWPRLRREYRAAAAALASPAAWTRRFGA